MSERGYSFPGGVRKAANSPAVGFSTDLKHWPLGTDVPLGADGSVKLSVRFRARKHDDALEFIDALEASPCFSDVYPHRDSEPKAPSTDFDMTLDASHDPFCGSPPPGLPKKIRAATGRRSSRG